MMIRRQFEGDFLKAFEIGRWIAAGRVVSHTGQTSKWDKQVGQTRCRFRNNSEIETLILKRSSVENKAKLSQLARAAFVTIAKLTH